MKVIGRGAFTTAYRKDRNTVILKSRDNVKECMSMGWFPSSNLFPAIKRLSYNDDGFSMYEMKYINKVTAPKKQLVKSHYELYKKLRELQYHGDVYSLIRRIEKLDVYTYIKEHLIHAIEALMNYGEDISFEISPRNIGVTKNGKLILLDCFFFKSALNR